MLLEHKRYSGLGMEALSPYALGTKGIDLGMDALLWSPYAIGT